MRFNILFLTLVLGISSTFAQLNGDGYYRIQNAITGRYVYVTDDYAELNYQTTSADMYALQLWSGFDKASSDASTVCYIKCLGKDDKGTPIYDIQAQGTGLREMLSAYIYIAARDNGTYRAYASHAGITKYLGDGEAALSLAQGVLSDGSYAKKDWNIIPLTQNEGEYFGLKPSFSLDNEHYVAFYASFPFSFASSGMKAMYIDKVDNGMAVYKEVSGVVPAETAVFIKCSSSEPANNKLVIGGSATALTDNMLQGVYFNNPAKGKHNNQTPYDPQTMRMLGVTSSGKLGFVRADIDFIPANACYLKVPVGTSDELLLATEEEYQASLPTTVSIDKTSLTLTEGDTEQLSASLAPATAQTNLTWSSSNASVASVSTSGLVKAETPGTAQITVKTSNGLSATCNVQVEARFIAVSAVTFGKSSFELFEGESTKIFATVLPEDATNKILHWESVHTDIATVDENGNIKALKAGETEIKATSTDGTNLSASAKVTVKPILAESITLNSVAVELLPNKELQLYATVSPEKTSNKSVKWESSNAEVATVDGDGLVKTLAPGEAVITASTTDGSNLSAACKITVVEEVFLAESIELDCKERIEFVSAEFMLTATILPEKTSNKSVKWESGNAEVATVNANGLVKAIAPGEAFIIVSTTDGSDLSDTCKLTVKPVLAESIVLNFTEKSDIAPFEFLLEATILPENATNTSVKWESNNEEVATVDGEGLVKVLKEGEAVITVSTTDGTALSATCIINALSGIEEVFVDSKPVKVFHIKGAYVKTVMSLQELESLPSGLYVVDRKKIFIR